MLSENRETYLRAVALSAVISILLIPLGFWARRLDVGPGVVPIYDSEGRSFWLFGVLLAVIAGALFQYFDREPAYALSTARDRDVRYEPISELPTGWILPLVTTFGAVMLLSVYHSILAILACALGCFLVLSLGVVVRHHLFDADLMSRQRARGAYTILIHAVAFVTLSMVYINKVRSLFSATAVLFFGALLLLQLTEGEDTIFGRRLVYALIGGLLLGQVTWVLNYWKATGWTGGAALLVFFYFAGGLILSELREGVRLREIVEYGAIGALAFGIVVFSLFG